MSCLGASPFITALSIEDMIRCVNGLMSVMTRDGELKTGVMTSFVSISLCEFCYQLTGMKIDHSGALIYMDAQIQIAWRKNYSEAHEKVSCVDCFAFTIDNDKFFQ